MNMGKKQYDSSGKQNCDESRDCAFGLLSPQKSFLNQRIEPMLTESTWIRFMHKGSGK